MILIQNQVISLEILPECAILNVSVHLAEENRRSQGQQLGYVSFLCLWSAKTWHKLVLVPSESDPFHPDKKMLGEVGEVYPCSNTWWRLGEIASRQLFFTLQGESPFFDFTFLGGRLRRNVSSFFLENQGNEGDFDGCLWHFGETPHLLKTKYLKIW